MPRKVHTTIIKAGKKTKKCLQTAAWQTCKCILWTVCAPCICCAVLFLPRGRHHRQDRGDVYEAAKPQMPAPRRRALSIPSSKFQDDQCLLEQPQSAFMTKLPLEIRRMIYEHALGRRLIHASVVEGQLLVQGCNSPRACRGARFDYPAQKRLEVALPLLRTCRLIYSEAIDYLYTSNTFVLTNSLFQYATVDHLSYFMLPQRIAQIRNVHISWELETNPFYPLIGLPGTPIDSKYRSWNGSWLAVTKFTGLRRLHITLIAPSCVGYSDPWLEIGPELLVSIPRIEAERFVITLPSDAWSTDVRMNSPQCVLRLPSAEPGSRRS